MIVVQMLKVFLLTYDNRVAPTVQISSPNSGTSVFNSCPLSFSGLIQNMTSQTGNYQSKRIKQTFTFNNGQCSTCFNLGK